MRKLNQFIRFLRPGGDVECTNELGTTPLMEAAYYGHSNIVEMLIKQFNAKWTAVDHEGKSPFMYSSAGGHPSTLTLLRDIISQDTPSFVVYDYENKKVRFKITICVFVYLFDLFV